MVYTREIIVNKTTWTMPSNVVNNEIYVEMIGGGGGAFKYDFRGASAGYNCLYNVGGGSGYFNNGYVRLNAGTRVIISIGANGTYRLSGTGGGGYGNSGGTTSFGTYLSANGGSAANIIANGSIIDVYGGSGGAGGGISFSNYNFNGYVYDNGMTTYFNLIAGTGYQFGGGGVYVDNNASGNFEILSIKAGNGGPWGGGGGIHSLTCDNQTPGIGGANGGNGGTLSVRAENGTNTRVYNMEGFGGLTLNGRGRRGNNGGGGGGYGGDGGNNGGGGGGYGYYGEGGVGSYSIYGGGGGGYSSGGYGGGGGMRVSDSMFRLGEGGTWSSESRANGTSGV